MIVAHAQQNMLGLFVSAQGFGGLIEVPTYRVVLQVL